MSLSRTIEILDRLISFPTISRDTNLHLVSYVKEILEQCGAKITLVPNTDATKASLYAVIGPSEEGGILLSGHTDVVPVEGQAWTSDPFQLTERCERLYARGTCDMKGFLACMLVAAERASRQKLSRPLHLAFSYDEEIGCVGVRPLIDAMRKFPILPKAGIVGEPTMLEVVTAHKGKVAGRIICKGQECHSSLAPDGLNAIHLASDVISFLRDVQSKIVNEGKRDSDFAMPFTTVHVGMIKGGTALNIVPKECSMDFEIRNIPEDDPRAIIERLQHQTEALTRKHRTRFENAEVQVEILNAYPSLHTECDIELVRIMKQRMGQVSTRKVDFGTEGGLFSDKLNLPIVVCGPGDIKDAHKPDEFISREQLSLCNDMLQAVVSDLM